VDVLEGRVEIPGGDFDLNVPKLVKVVRDNGFTISSLKIKATGTVKTTKAGYVFVVSETNARYSLNRNDMLSKLLDQSQKTNKPFDILGTVVIPPPKGEAVPDDPVGSLTIEMFVPANSAGGSE